MTSIITKDFKKLFQRLPENVKTIARKQYKIWKENQNHPSLYFKKVHEKLPIYSIRDGISWRVLGTIENDTMIWFWIGHHTDYDKILRRL